MAFPMPKLLVALILSLFLVGCATNTGNLNRKQIAMLNDQGFVKSEQGWTFGFSDRLLFALDTSTIAVEQKPVITRITQALLSVDINKISVEGHTDNTGSDRHNLDLSLRRAQSVAEVMQQAGMKSENMRIVGLGSAYPILPNDTELNRQENRRVVLIVDN